MRVGLDSSWKWSFALVGVAFLAYSPAINNGFIADDFVILARLDILKADPLHLLRIAPENFRLTSYFAFGMLKTAFGPDYRAFYLFNILLHAVNVLLLRRLVMQITQNAPLAFTSALLFAVFQAPQEAVTWLAAMNETLMGFFILMTAILWTRGKYVWALAAYSAALFSKESAPLLLVIIPFLEIQRGKPAFSRQYARLLLPTAGFAAIFLYTLRSNFMIEHGTYGLGLHAILVWLNSLHRLFWPWAYVSVGLVRIVNGKWPEPKVAGRLFAWTAALMLPYIFVTYTKDIPSRQLYLASAVFATSMAAAVLRFNSKRLQALFLVCFATFNIGYIWIRKDAQMEERAAPTTSLIRELKNHAPQPTLIVGFPYPYPEIAKSAALFAPGWKPDELELSQTPEDCRACLILQWDPRLGEYHQRNP